MEAISPRVKGSVSRIRGVSSVMDTVIRRHASLKLDRERLTTVYNVPRSSMTQVRSYGAAPGLKALLGVFRRLNLRLAMEPAGPAIWGRKRSLQENSPCRVSSVRMGDPSEVS